MAFSGWQELRELYRFERTQTMIVHHRFYDVSREVSESQGPDQGEALSGSGVTAERCISVSSAPQKGANAVDHVAHITSYVLSGTSETVNGKTLLRLDGYPIRRDTANKTMYTVVYVGALITDLPSYGDAYSEDEFALAGSPTKVPEQWPGLFGSNVTYGKSRNRTTGGLLEKARSRGQRRVGDAHWMAQIDYECLDTQLQAFEDSLWYTPHPTISAVGTTPVAALIVSNQGYDPDIPGHGLLQVFYKTLRVPGEAKVEITGSLQYKKVNEDLEGLQLVGPTEVAGEEGEYFMSRGSNQIVDPKRMFVWKAAFDSYAGLNVLNGLMGKINSASLPNFPGGPGAGVLRMFRQELTHRWVGSNLWYVNIYFEEEEEGWNNVAKRQTHVRITKERPRFQQIAGQKTYEKITGDGVVVEEFEPGVLQKDGDDWTHDTDSDEQDTVLYKEASFEVLNALLLKW